MARLTLVIGNKNYSSWSLRPWMALSMAGIAFDEKLIPFGDPQFGRAVRKISPAGRVPILIDGKTVVWDSMAILEYLAELYPERHLWPRTRAARAMARSACNEMHAGFGTLRNACPMNLRRPTKPVPLTDALVADVKRVEQLWRECRAAHGKGGPFLFGKFSNADAMFAPVVTRLETYAFKVSRETRAYMDVVLAPPAFQSWRAGAARESWVVPHDEVD
jgi:glutathione S-transferase